MEYNAIQYNTVLYNIVQYKTDHFINISISFSHHFNTISSSIQHHFIMLIIILFSPFPFRTISH